MFNLEGLKCLIWKIVIFEDGDILLIPVIWCNIHIYKFLSVGNISFFYFTPTSPVWQWSPPGSTRWRSDGAVHSRGSGLQPVRLVTLMVGYAIGYRNDIEMMDIVGATCLMHLKSSSLIWNQACSCCYDLDKFIQAGSDGSCFAMGVVFFFCVCPTWLGDIPTCSIMFHYFLRIALDNSPQMVYLGNCLGRLKPISFLT